MIPLRKTYEVVGYVGDAELVCRACATDEMKKEAQPVFLGDVTDEDSCAWCFEKLEEV